MQNSIRLLTGLSLMCSLAMGQVQPTSSFTVKGDIKNELTISTRELIRQKVHTIGTIDITNHKGELRGTARAMKGVLLRDLLLGVTLNEENPKSFSAFYFVCEGTDNYKVVYSWNELFNTAVGDHVFIVTEKDETDMHGHEDGILMISTEDRMTGRRFVKNLETIRVRRAD